MRPMTDMSQKVRKQFAASASLVKDAKDKLTERSCRAQLLDGELRFLKLQISNATRA